MRLSTKILTLISISVSLSCHIKYPDVCKNEMSEYNDCLEGDAKAYSSERCQEYYKKHFELLPNCKKALNAEEISCEESNHMGVYSSFIFKNEGKDENGEECPMVTIKMEEDEEVEDYQNRMLEAAKNTCGSKKCVEASIKGFNVKYEAHKIDWEIEKDEFYENVLSILKSCGNTKTITNEKTTNASKKNKTTTTVKKVTTTQAKKSTTTAKKSATTNISTNGRCGKGYGICPNNKCCSKYGYCGKSDKHCSVEQGCQSEFGVCSSSSKAKATNKPSNKATTKRNNTKTKTTTIKTNVKASTSGRCGKGIGKCPNNQCCSKYGYCGNGVAYCGAGCQSEFGKCN